MPQQPVYGFNNWYCDYGNISAEERAPGCRLHRPLAPQGGNRPYMVIDDGWQANHGDAEGEWDRGNAKFPDMAALAADMVKAGTRPGIWVRLLVAQPGQPEGWKLARDRAYLDPFRARGARLCDGDGQAPARLGIRTDQARLSRPSISPDVGATRWATR